MIIRVERAAPSDQECLLVLPVDFRLHFIGSIYADILEILTGDRRQICTHLISLHTVYRKAQSFSILLVNTVIVQLPALFFDDCFCFIRIIGFLLHTLIIEFVSFDWAVSRNALTEKYALYHCVSVNGAVDRVDQFLVLLPERIVEVVHDAAIVGGLHIVNGETFFAFEVLRILRRQLRQIQFSRLYLESLGVVVFHDLEYDRSDTRSSAPVLFVGGHRYALAFIP